MNRLLRAIVDGFGLSIGHNLWDEAKGELEKLVEGETDEQRTKREAQEKKDEARRLKDEARALEDSRREAERAEKERQRQEKRRQGEIDDELAAMKRKLGKK